MAEAQTLDSTGSVTLDIGDGVGAVVVCVDAALAGREIEARADEGARHRAHATVLERRTVAGSVYAVVIAGLAAGPYTLWLDGEPLPTEAPVVVSSGAVTEVELYATARP